jgi:hypothetical protein
MVKLSSVSQPAVWVAASLAFIAACTRAPEDTTATLPDVDTTGFVPDTGGGFEPVDTGDVVLNEVPLHTVTIRQWGTSVMAPEGGPYTSLAGELTVQEYLDGDIPDPDFEEDTDLDTDRDTDEARLDCDLLYALAGVPSEQTCAGCAFVFDVQFSLTSGTRDTCHDPFLPQTGDTWTLGFIPTTGEVHRNVGDSGTWLPWYNATLEDNALTYEWLATLGISIEDEEM